VGQFLYRTRLYWHRGVGVACYDDVGVVLRHAPVIEGLEGMTEIDFIPGVMAEVRIGDEKARSMEPVERSRAMAVLISMATGARDPLDGEMTIAVVQR
jgi:hypothetical protein